MSLMFLARRTRDVRLAPAAARTEHGPFGGLSHGVGAMSGCLTWWVLAGSHSAWRRGHGNVSPAGIRPRARSQASAPPPSRALSEGARDAPSTIPDRDRAPRATPRAAARVARALHPGARR